MKFICLIASTLLIVLINQQSTNGLPVVDMTTEIPCLKGFELVDGKCQPIKQELEFGTTEKSKEMNTCPTGQIHNEHGICVDIISKDQPATTVESKKIDELPLKIKSKSSNPTDEVEEKTTEILHSTVESEHTTESLHHTHEKEEVAPTESSHTEDKHLENTTELSHLEDEHKEEKKKPVHRTKELKKDATEPSHLEDEHVEYTTETSHSEDEHKDEKKKKPITHTKEDEEEKTEEKPETDDIPKGCPPGTKLDDQGACQDEVELKPKKPSNLKKILQDQPCPSDMEKYKGKCVYIKSKITPVESVYDSYKSQTNEDSNNAGELVYQDAKLGCPPGSEYFENNVCRKVTRPSVDTPIEKPEISCGVNEVFIDGKCAPKENVEPLPSTVAKKTNKLTKDKPVKEVPVDNEEEQPPKSTENKKITEPEDEQS